MKTSDYPIWHVVVASVTSGMLIGVYILVLGRLNVDQSVKDPLKTQSIAAAKHILSITEIHMGFGAVGLADSRSQPGWRHDVYSHRVTSLNSAKAAIYSAAVLSRLLKNDVMQKCVLEDLRELNDAESRLMERINLAVKPDTIEVHEGNSGSSAGGGSLHSRIFDALKRDPPTDLTPDSVNIQLGRWQSKEVELKTMPAPRSEKDGQYTSKGWFLADFPVPVLDNNFVRFYPQPADVVTVDPSQFTTAAPGVVPNAVLLEVNYLPRDLKSETAVHIVRRSCALLGGAPPAMPASCFAFRFPQGLPESFKTPLSLLQATDWLKDGTWEQASGGSIPGSGKLKLTIEPVLPAMSSGNALAVSLYHWLRQLHPAPDPLAVLQALRQEFLGKEGPEQLTEATANPVNSSLVQDTGARERGILKGMQPGSEGQRGIEECFEYPDSLNKYPESAMPLYVDRNGNLNLSGRTGFDLALVKNYLEAVYNTNLAALESSAISKMVRRQSSIENSRVDEHLSINKQELASLTNRLAALKSQKATAKQIAATERNIESLKTSISADQNRKAQLRVVNQLTTTVIRNSDRTSSTTYELTATAFNQLRGGLHQIDGPNKAFLIGRKFVFTPFTEAVDEAKFFEAAGWALTDPSFDEIAQAKISPWFQKHVPILSPWQEKFPISTNVLVEGRPLDQVLNEVAIFDRMQPLTAIISSAELTEIGKPRLHRTTQYPFAGTPIPEDQAFYYSSAATTTGAESEVQWSVIIRDVVFHHASGSRAKPIAVPDTSWLRRLNPPLAEAPGLACEFQLRRPLPHLKDLPDGAYITDPNKRLMTPQVPPVPAELM